MGLFDFFKSNKSKIASYYQRNAILLDVRTLEEYSQGAIKESKHIPIDQIQNQIATIKHWERPVIAYCQSGVRSAKAVALLNKNGIDTINGGGWRSLQKKLRALDAS